MRESAHMLWLVACAIGATLIVALVIIFRRARAHRELELADELLDKEIRAAGDTSRTDR
jgi:hypothetical protein